MVFSFFNIQSIKVIITPGAVTAVAVSIAASVDVGDEILIPDPSWPNYISATLSLGAKPVMYQCRYQNDWLPQVVGLFVYQSTTCNLKTACSSTTL